MIIAAAQTRPQADDINGNLEDHYRLLHLAAENGVHLIIFPELSITGYQREAALSMALVANDSRLAELKKLAIDFRLTIVAGAPILIDTQLYIGSFILHPDGSTSIYTKQFLHAGEEMYFASSFDYNPMLKIKGEQISLAICADIDHPEHPQNAKATGSTLYCASLFFTPGGIPAAYQSLSTYANSHSMNVLMSNYSGPSYGWEAGGRSAFWNSEGHLVAAMDNASAGLLLIAKENGVWAERKIIKIRD